MFRPICFTAASSSFCRRPVMNTYAPSATKRLAVSNPIPLLPPVTTATLPDNLPMSVILAQFDHSMTIEILTEEDRASGLGSQPPDELAFVALDHVSLRCEELALPIEPRLDDAGGL